jgi:hypothetical protein
MSEVKEAGGYDIIGDVHGCARALATLLLKMGYQKVNGVYRHPQRMAIFVGDIIDRGPRVREALHLVKDMVDAGAAQIVMGNHEYNAIGFCTQSRPGSPHAYLREHNARHCRQIQETLEQFANYGPEWSEFLAWFRTLPLYLGGQGFRVVHACWDTALIESFSQEFPDGRISDDFLHASTVRDSFPGLVMDRLLRGTDLPLPDGRSMVGKDGLVRSFFRTKFWADKRGTYGDVVFQPDGLPDDLVNRPLSAEEKAKLLSYEAHLPPVFVGHYWLSGTPRPIRPNIACLDYSSVKYGKMVAYRFDREPVIKADKFVWIEVFKGMPVP